MVLDSPGAGRVYNVYVKGTAIPASDAQNYSLVVNGAFTYTGEAPPPPSITFQLSTVRECFSSTDRVSLRGGGSKSMGEIEIGDEIQTLTSQGHLEYSPVVYLPHGRNDVQALFIDVLLEDGEKIRMTPEHLVPVFDCKFPTQSKNLERMSSSFLSQHLIPARRVNVTDCLLVASSHDTSYPPFALKMVVDVIEQVVANGVYTAVTINPFLVSTPHSQKKRKKKARKAGIIAISFCSSVSFLLAV